MIRLLVDPIGEGHSDLWLKVDAFPTFSQIADSYFLAPETASVQEKVKILLRDWISKISDIDSNSPILLAFDVSDEYVSGFRMTVQKKGIFVEYLTSRGSDFDVSSDFISDAEQTWLMDKRAILENLDWSLLQLD